MKFPVGWQIKDYVETGESWIRYDQDHNSYIYINIPKNASSWMMHAFCCDGFNYNFITNQMADPVHEYHQSDHNYPVPTYVIILRDPINRWVSGCAQAFFGCAPDDPCFFMNYTNEELFDRIVFDEHTAPQTLFLKDVDLSRTIYFDCTPDLKTNFNNWIQDKFKVTYRIKNPVGNDSNISTEGQPRTFQKFQSDRKIIGWSQQQITDELQSRLDANPQYVQRLKEFYADDYDLRESVSFYGAR
jgi:hypothetical protein